MRFSLQDVKKQVQRRGGELYVSLHFLGAGELQAEIARLIAYYERLLGQPQQHFSQEEARACIGDYRIAHCLMATLNAWYTWRQNDWAETIQQLPQSTGIQAHLESAGITSPAQLRLALFDYVNEHHQGFLEEKKRQHALQSFAASYHLDVSALEYLLALDTDEEAVLVREDPHPPTAGAVAALYNRWVFEVALSNASNVRFVIDCNAFSRLQQERAAGRNVIGTGVGAVIKRLCYLARRLGVYYDLAYASTLPAASVASSSGQASNTNTSQSQPSLHLQLTLYGPQEMTGVPQQYGLRLARLCRVLLGYGVAHQHGTQEPVRGKPGVLSSKAILEAEAIVHFLQRSYHFNMHTYLIGGQAHRDPVRGTASSQLPSSPSTNARDVVDASSFYDSSIERSFAEAFSALESSHGTDGWQLEREPEPLLLEQGILIPDFALTRAGRRLYIEILGFWTPAYRERKIQKLQQLKGRGDLILAIPSEARPAFMSLTTDFPIVWYDSQLSATELLYLLRNRYDDFAERLALIDVAIVRERVRSLGLLSEQACYDLLHCCRRSELQRAAEHVICEDITFTTGIGLYQVDWLEQMKRSFVEWMDALAVAPLPLADVLQTCKARWPALADCEDATLEALFGLWPEIRIHRTSIFDAMVEFSRPELQTPEDPPLQAGLLQEREEAGNPVWGTANQGAAGPLAEREVASRSPISLPPQAAKKSLATTLPLQDEDNTKKQVRERRAKYKKHSTTEAVQEDLWG
jgi:predicted nuclease of restriction endonuclease-like RecB superfamily